jgi:hypothetical protein
VIKEQTAMPAPALSQPCTPLRRIEDREFMTMSRVFGEHGGMVSADELVRSMRRNLQQPLSIVGRWVVDREVVQLVWRSHIYLPCFQFARDPISIRGPVSEVVRELRDAFDDWELAFWFANRNELLNYEPPVELICNDVAAVVRAAQIDRFIAKG